MKTKEAIQVINNECETTLLLFTVSNDFVSALCEAIKSMEEIEQYREIGTVEEFREAVEKQKQMKPH